jgi:hypothetical protein
MMKSNSASVSTLSVAGKTVPSAIAVTSKPSEASLSSAMSIWMASISRGTKRMAEDEAYRLEIAKDLS